MRVAFLVPNNKFGAYAFVEIKCELARRHHSSDLLDDSLVISKDTSFDIIIHKWPQLLSNTSLCSKIDQIYYKILTPVTTLKHTLYRSSMFSLFYEPVCGVLHFPTNHVINLPPNSGKWIDAVNSVVNHSNELYPVVIKPDIACGTKSSHHLAVVPASSSLPDQITTTVPSGECVLQPFFPGSLLKFYVISLSPSCTILWKSDCSAFHPQITNFQKEVFLFDSQKLKPKDPSIKRCFDSNWLEIAVQINNKLNLTFFGFDVVVSDNCNYCVDINYFPSFSGCQNFGELAVDALEAHLKLKTN
ncbi:hypothetical protein RCL1_005612 [Eukaryota sp. TZLM3-RCL]